MIGSEVAGLQGSAATPPDASASRLFIISAPSGAGKTTLCNALRRHFITLTYSISHTTRPARPGEQNGRDYFFISQQEFEKGIDSQRWAEWAQVHGHYYGTSAQWIESTLKAGKNILMDIDVQGTRQLKRRFPRAETIFIMAPSLAELERRLWQRAKDNEDIIALRLQNAQIEIAQSAFYDHILINDDLDQATQALIALLKDSATTLGRSKSNERP